MVKCMTDIQQLNFLRISLAHEIRKSKRSNNKSKIQKLKKSIKSLEIKLKQKDSLKFMVGREMA